MSKTSITVLGVVVSVFAVCFFSYVSAYNLGNRYEQKIVHAWENNENILAQYSQKVQEAAQIPAMQRDDVLKILTEGLKARYGEDGSQSVFQWIQEQNPNVDSAVYTKLQQIIEAGRNEFKVAQTQLIDSKRGYRTFLGSFWMGTWLKIAGYPEINLNDYRVITTKYASDAFKSGIESAPLKLR